MELKVWVEGIQRIVCGVTEATTCQDVVYALAHATGKTGRFTLVERWRHNERLLPPHERPLRVLAKWGEYAGDVQLLLRRSPSPPGGGGGPAADGTAKLGRPSTTTDDHILEPLGSKQQLQRSVANTTQSPPPNSNHQGRDPLVRKSLTFSGSGGGGAGGAVAPPNYTDPPPFRDSSNGKRDWSVLPRGVVKGVPQQNFKDHHVAANSPDCVGVSGMKERSVQAAVQEPSNQCRGRPNVALSPNQPPQYHPPPTSSNPPQYQPPPTIHRTEPLPPHNGRSGHVAHGSGGAASESRDPCDGGGSVATAGHHANHGDADQGVARGASHLRAASASQESSACAMVDPSPPAAMSPNSLSPSGHPRHLPHPDMQQHQLPGPPPAAFRGPPMAGSHRQPSPSNIVSPTEQHQHRSPGSVPRIPVPIHMGTPKSRRNLLSEFRRHDLEEELREDSFLGRGHQERVVYDARYKDLVRLVNLQREKLGRQQADLTQCDAEIMYWEEKQKDHLRQIEIIEREIQKAEFSGRDADEEAVQLNKLHLEDENAKYRQQEKMLQSELTLLRSKLSNCETELLQCKNKIRLLMDEIIENKRFLSNEEEDRKQRETVMLHEIEDLQRDISERIKQYDNTVDSVDKLDFDIRKLESAILEKKKQIECLVHEMKEANLASLTFTPSEEIRLLLEGGALKGPGSSRKIVGSPRQLENAVPTSKNPHGVWV